MPPPSPPAPDARPAGQDPVRAAAGPGGAPRAPADRRATRVPEETVVSPHSSDGTAATRRAPPRPAAASAAAPARQPRRRHRRPAAACGPGLGPDVLADLARRLARSPSHLTAAQLTRASLQHRHELPRVAAAAAHFELASHPEPAPSPILARRLASADPLARALAATALARIAPGGRAAPGVPPAAGPLPRPRAPSHTSLLVHGTFARSSTLVAAGRRLPRVPARGGPAGPLQRRRPLRLVRRLERRGPGARRRRPPRVGRRQGPRRASTSSRTATAAASRCWPARAASRSASW